MISNTKNDKRVFLFLPVANGFSSEGHFLRGLPCLANDISLDLTQINLWMEEKETEGGNELLPNYSYYQVCF